MSVTSSLGRGETVDRHHAQGTDHRYDSDRQPVWPSSPRRWRHSARRGERERGRRKRSAVQNCGCGASRGGVDTKGRGL